MKKLPKIFERGENTIKTSEMAKEALRNGLGPAHNSNKTFGVIPGKIEKNVYYAIIMERRENERSKPVDWYAWSPKSNFVPGFGGWHNSSYDEFIKANPWVKEELDSLEKYRYSKD